MYAYDSVVTELYSIKSFANMYVDMIIIVFGGDWAETPCRRYMLPTKYTIVMM